MGHSLDGKTWCYVSKYFEVYGGLKYSCNSGKLETE